MIPSESFIFEIQQLKTYENDQGNHFLNHFELQQGKWSTIAFVADSVGGNLKTIFK